MTAAPALAMSRLVEFNPLKKSGNKRQNTMNSFILISFSFFSSFSFSHRSGFFSGIPVQAVTGEVDGIAVVVCFERGGNGNNREGHDGGNAGESHFVCMEGPFEWLIVCGLRYGDRPTW